MAFRVGITGTRNLDAAGAEGASVSVAVASVLDTIIAAVEASAESADGRATYDSTVPPSLRCLSPLAQGADQLFAQVALDKCDTARSAGIDLCVQVALPFDIEDYKSSQKSEAGDLLQSGIAGHSDNAACGTFELDGASKDTVVRRSSYEAVGRTVVRNADLLIAIWDEADEPKGRGGTRDIVGFALDYGVPVWRIDPSGAKPDRFLEDELEFWGRQHDRSDRERLESYLKAVLLPPPPGDHADGWNGLAEYLSEPLVLNRNLWLLHARIIGSIRKLARERTPGESAGHAKAANLPALLPTLWPFGRQAYDPHRTISAQLSGAYQHRYRTSYLLALVCAAIALGYAVMGVSGMIAESMASTVEFAALLVIALLVYINHHGHWHKKYTNYRLLNELLRPSGLLNELGWSLPYAQIRRAAGYDTQSWAAWFAAARVRALVLPSGSVSDSLPDLRNRIVGYLERQIAFHHQRASECNGAARWFNIAGVVTFLITLLLVAFKVAIASHLLPLVVEPLPLEVDFHDLEHGLSILTAGMPALSAAFFGLKAYEEFEPLAELSEKMIGDLESARGRIRLIDLDRPLASQVLAEEFLDAVTVMLSEVSGWAELFRSRPVEA